MREILRKKLRLALPIAVVAAEIIFLVWCNLFHVADLLDYDFAKMLRHMYEMVENHSIFLEGWNYITTAELDCATLPAMVFFAMTGNVYLAYGLANIFDIVLWIFVTQLLFDTIDLKVEYRLLFWGLLFLTYDWGMLLYTNMMFFAGAQYVYKVLIPVVLVTILLKRDNVKMGGGSTALYFIFAILLLVSSVSSGVYVFITGIVPILIVAWLYECSSPIFSWNNEPTKKLIFVTVLTLILTAIGVFVCKVQGINPNSSSVVLGDMEHNFVERIIACFNSFISLIHSGYSGVELTSLRGIAMCANWFLVFIICLGFLSFRRFKRFVDESKVDEKISCMEKAETMLIAIFFWNFVIVMLTDIADRYHLIGTVPIMICGVINTGQILSRCNNRIRNLPLVIAFLSLFLVLIYNVREIPLYHFASHDWNRKQAVSIVNNTVNILKKADADTCIVLNNTEIAEYFRATDFDNKYYSYIVDENQVFSTDFYRMSVNELFAERHIILASQEDFDKLPKDMQLSYEQTGQEIVGLSVYTLTAYQ